MAKLISPLDMTLLVKKKNTIENDGLQRTASFVYSMLKGMTQKSLFELEKCILNVFMHFDKTWDGRL